MKKVVFIFLLCAVTVSPFTAMAGEDGWKDLKWGMTLKEIQGVYINEKTGEKCNELSEQVDSSFAKYSVVYCDGDSADIMMYDGKFFLKNVLLTIEGNSLKEQLDNLNKVLNQLKDKYPKGNISYVERKNFRGQIFKYPVFKYESDKITIESKPNEKELDLLMFADTKILKKLREEVQNKKQEEIKQREKEEKLKSPF